MPCYTPPHAYCHHGIEDVDNMICEITGKIKEFDRTRKREECEFQELKKYSDKVTDMLCRTMKIIDDVNLYNKKLDTPGVYGSRMNVILSQEIEDWWEKHKQWDKDRVR